MNCRHLFISPHFDDAIGSCGGFISRLADAGEQVEVITIFGGEELEPYSQFADELHSSWGLTSNIVKHRMFENEKSCEVLGCKAKNCEFYEALYRKGLTFENLYPDQEKLFGEIHPDDSKLMNSIYDRLTQHILPGDHLYFPCGIGHHVDHVISAVLGERFSKNGEQIYFYKEFYYQDDVPERDVFQGMLVQYIDLESHEVESKILSFSCYASQISTLYLSAKEMEEYFCGQGQQETYYGRKTLWTDQ